MLLTIRAQDAVEAGLGWRFSPAAAPTARDFLFHPTQAMTEVEDGSLTVRCTSSGHLEMIWHLYMWGDAVKVLAPESLREMVDRHQRGDFSALP
jgi:predicted DNA-binding transcriptional regulator YafY